MKRLLSHKPGAIVLGALLFFLLGRFAVIPSPVPTVNLCLQYGLLAFWAVVFGPIVGGLAGLLGHICIDLTYGAPCWSWMRLLAMESPRPCPPFSDLRAASVQAEFISACFARICITLPCSRHRSFRWRSLLSQYAL